ncbi:MAG: saccharopine dehydrogenase C-terminal domain-containing protein [Ferruginibacter sp.]
MKKILLFGAGKSSGVLIDYLLKNAVKGNWRLTVADAAYEQILQKTNNHPRSRALAMNITEEIIRYGEIEQSDVVISMLPPALHILVAKDCVEAGKHLLTASYVDDELKKLGEEAKKKNILLLCEMGLDPGIDHMSALSLLHEIVHSGGTITSFKSHCGGLVAPESDNNPWHYKISWNPRNIVLAGKAGAHYYENGEDVKIPYEQLFNQGKEVNVPGMGNLSYYPNRDSTSYRMLYNLPEVKTFIRTTLRHPDFMKAWNEVIALGLTNEEMQLSTHQETVYSFVKKFLNLTGKDEHEFSEELYPMLSWLGMFDNQRQLDTGVKTAAEILQSVMERKLALNPGDKDMIVMMHEAEYTIDGKHKKAISSLVVRGQDNVHTAMAKTVGLPLAIAAELLLENKISLSGVCVPVLPEIYKPVLARLRECGIIFHETIIDN